MGRDGSEESIKIEKNLYEKIIVRKFVLQILIDKYLLSEFHAKGQRLKRRQDL